MLHIVCTQCYSGIRIGRFVPLKLEMVYPYLFHARKTCIRWYALFDSPIDVLENLADGQQDWIIRKRSGCSSGQPSVKRIHREKEGSFSIRARISRNNKVNGKKKKEEQKKKEEKKEFETCHPGKQVPTSFAIKGTMQTTGLESILHRTR